MDSGESSKAEKLSVKSIVLDNFPGEEPLAHEGQEWLESTVSKLSAAELMVVAETGVPAVAYTHHVRRSRSEVVPFAGPIERGLHLMRVMYGLCVSRRRRLRADVWRKRSTDSSLAGYHTPRR